jgi:peptidyl-prolyl cis-trans isomerase D
MLDIVRANTKSIFTWLIVLGIVFIFAVNFGPGSLSKGQSGCGAAPPYAARVNGEVIPAGEWERQYDQLLRFYQQQAGDQFTRELAAQLQLPQQALGFLVDRELVVQEARRRGIVATDEEISATVHRMPAFQENGQFQYQLYLDSVRGAYGSPGKFEDALREDLLYQKMLAAVGQTVKVSEGQVRDTWRSSSDRASLVFVSFPLAAAQADVKVSDADAKAFADANGDRVKKRYEENAARYDQKKKVRVRHVLVAVAPGAPADQEEAARKRIEAAAARVKAGEDFAKVAGEVSDDANTKGRGGDLGYVAEGLADEAFAKAALGLEKGQVSEPVRSASGWHLVKAEDVVAAQKVSLDEAKLAIAKELVAKDRAEALVKERALAALDAARKGKTLTELFPAADAAQKANRKPVVLGAATIVAEETGPFSTSAGFVPKIGPAPELAKAVEAAKAGDVLPKLYEGAAGPVVAVVKSRERPNDSEYQKQRGTIETRLLNQKTEEVRRSWLAELRKVARIEENTALLASAAQGGQAPVQ